MKISDTVECICPVDVIHDLSILVKNFGEGNDYFKVLVNVFQSVLLTAEHDHLRTFYMIGR